MLDVIFGFFQGVIGFLNSLLPTSPFQDYLQAVEGARLGLAWLNWLMPIHTFVTIFGLWLAAGLAIAAVRFAIGETLNVGSKLL